MSNLVGLKFCFYEASQASEDRHPQKVMRELGITYKESVPQSMGDMWQFFGCDIPDGLTLPPYLIIVDRWRQHCD